MPNPIFPILCLLGLAAIILLAIGVFSELRVARTEEKHLTPAEEKRDLFERAFGEDEDLPGAIWMLPLWAVLIFALVNLFFTLPDLLFRLLLPIGLLAAGGHWAHSRRQHTAPWRLVVGILLAVGAAFWAYFLSDNALPSLTEAAVFGLAFPFLILNKGVVLLGLLTLLATRRARPLATLQIMLVGTLSGALLALILIPGALSWALQTYAGETGLPGQSWFSLVTAGAVALGTGPALVRWTQAAGIFRRFGHGAAAGALAGGVLYGLLLASPAGVAAQAPLYPLVRPPGVPEVQWLFALVEAINNTFPTQFGISWGAVFCGALLGGLTAACTPTRPGPRPAALWPFAVTLITFLLVTITNTIYIVILALLSPATQNIYNRLGILPVWHPDYMLTAAVLSSTLLLAGLQALFIRWLEARPPRLRLRRMAGLTAILMSGGNLLFAKWFFSNEPLLIFASLLFIILAFELLRASYRLGKAPPLTDPAARRPASRTQWVFSGGVAGLLTLLYSQPMTASMAGWVRIAVRLLPTIIDPVGTPLAPSTLSDTFQEFFIINTSGFFLAGVSLVALGGLCGYILALWERLELFFSLWDWLCSLMAWLLRPKSQAGQWGLALLGGLVIGGAVSLFPTVPTWGAALLMGMWVAFGVRAQNPQSWPLAVWALIALLALPAGIGLLSESADDNIWLRTALILGGIPAITLLHGGFVHTFSPSRRSVARLALLVVAAGMVNVVFSIRSSPASMQGSVSAFDGQTWQRFAPANIPLGERLTFRFHTDPAGRFWLSAGPALLLGETQGGWQSFSLDAFSGSEDIRLGAPLFFADDPQERGLWVAAQDQWGLLDPTQASEPFQQPTQSTASDAPGLHPPDEITGLAVGQNGTLFLTTYGEGVFRFALDQPLERAAWQHDTFQNSALKTNNIRGIYADQAGDIWLGTTVGLYRFADGGWQAVSPPGLEPGAAHWGFLEDAQGRFWVGGSGLTHREGDVWHAVARPPEWPPETEVTALYADRRGAIWVGTTDALARYDGRGWTTLAPDFPAAAFAEGPDASVWVGGEAGLARIQPGTDTLTLVDPETTHLATSSVADLHVDPHGTLWVAAFSHTWEAPSGTWALAAAYFLILAGWTIVRLRRIRPRQTI